MRISNLIIVLALVTTTPMLAVDGDLRVTFAIEPATTLPGIPVSFRFTFVNTAKTPVAVPHQMSLLVQSNLGNDFVARCGIRSAEICPLQGWPEGEVVPAGGAVTHDIAIDGSLRSGPLAFGDPRLARPAVFTLQAFFFDTHRRELDFATARMEPNVASNSVTLNVQEPLGIDAEVWT